MKPIVSYPEIKDMHSTGFLDGWVSKLEMFVPFPGHVNGEDNYNQDNQSKIN